MQQSSLPFDRDFPRAEFVRTLLSSLSCESVARTADREVRVTLAPQGEVESFDGSVAVVVHLGVDVDGRKHELLERRLTLMPSSCSLEPRRAERAWAAWGEHLPARLKEVAKKLTTEAALDPTRECTDEEHDSAGDLIWSVFDAVEAFGHQWVPSTPECRDWLAFDHLIVEWSDDPLSPLAELLESATTPLKRLAPMADGSLELVDGYRIDELGTTRLVTMRGYPPNFEALGNPSVRIVEERDEVSTSGGHLITVVDGRRQIAREAETLFINGSVPANLHWVRSGARARSLALELRSQVADASEVPMAMWLIERLRQGGASDEQPPLISAEGGWYALVAILRSLRGPEPPAREAVEAALRRMVELGAEMSPEDPKLFVGSADVLEAPLVEAERIDPSLAQLLRR